MYNIVISEFKSKRGDFNVKKSKKSLQPATSL
jgi:hypothetical protein